MVKARSGMIRARNREGDGSKAFKGCVDEKRNAPQKAREANRRTRARRNLRRAAERIKAAGQHVQAASGAGLEKLLSLFQKKRREAA